MSNNTMVKQYNALLFLQNPPKWKKYIYTTSKKKKTIVSSPRLYIMWESCDPPLVHGNMVIKSA